MNKEALEAAIIAGDLHWEGSSPSVGIYEAAVRAYLDNAVPADVKERVDSLRNEFDGATDGEGFVNSMKITADIIEAQAVTISGLRAEYERAMIQQNELRQQQAAKIAGLEHRFEIEQATKQEVEAQREKSVVFWAKKLRKAINRAEKAEAALAEANKALVIANGQLDVMSFLSVESFIYWQRDHRRALEAQGGENG